MPGALVRNWIISNECVSERWGSGGGGRQLIRKSVEGKNASWMLVSGSQESGADP